MNRRQVSLVLAIVLVGLVVAAGAAWWAGALDGLFRDDGQAPTALDVPPPAGLDLPEARTPRPVLRPAAGPRVSAPELRRRIAPLLRDADLGGHVGFAAYDLTHDRPLLSSGRGGFTPASTLKLFTTTAALEALGGDHVFTTSAVLGPKRRHRAPVVVLVGGGDPLLSGLSARKAARLDPAPATLAELAAQTARALKRRGLHRIAVGYDASRYVGPAESPDWEPGYVPEEVPPISPLWVDEGADPNDPYRRVLDPARVAAERFAADLTARSLTVVGAASEASGGRSRDTLGEVQSPPLRDIVGQVLERSDNAGAEVLSREVALASDRPASFRGGAAAVREVLGRLGVPLRGVATYDGSGLSRADRVTVAAMLRVLRLGSDDRHPELRDAVTQLPVAGFSGTLIYRFTGEDAAAGLGWVRAKTGTLSHVHGLAGTVVDRDGVAIAFVAMVDRVPLPDTLAARAILDEVAATVAGCGCVRPPR